MLLEQGVCVLLRTGLFRAYSMFCSSLIMILTKFYLSVQRIAIPTHSIKSVPWMINIFGLTVNYQWGFPLACCASIDARCCSQRWLAELDRDSDSATATRFRASVGLGASSPGSRGAFPAA